MNNKHHSVDSNFYQYEHESPQRQNDSTISLVWHWVWPVAPVLVLLGSQYAWRQFALGIYVIFLEPVYQIFIWVALGFAVFVLTLKIIFWRAQHAKPYYVNNQKPESTDSSHLL